MLIIAASAFSCSASLVAAQAAYDGLSRSGQARQKTCWKLLGLSRRVWLGARAPPSCPRTGPAPSPAAAYASGRLGWRAAPPSDHHIIRPLGIKLCLRNAPPAPSSAPPPCPTSTQPRTVQGLPLVWINDANFVSLARPCILPSTGAGGALQLRAGCTTVPPIHRLAQWAVCMPGRILSSITDGRSRDLDTAWVNLAGSGRPSHPWAMVTCTWQIGEAGPDAYADSLRHSSASNRRSAGAIPLGLLGAFYLAAGGRIPNPWLVRLAYNGHLHARNSPAWLGAA
jgi:hypothetical protein